MPFKILRLERRREVLGEGDSDNVLESYGMVRGMKRTECNHKEEDKVSVICGL